MAPGNQTRVAIIGATGYAGTELIRLLHDHPSVRITFLGSASQDGHALGDVFHHFDAETSALPLRRFSVDEHVEVADIFFMAMDNGQAMRIAPALLERGRRIIDLSADFRLRDPGNYDTWYHFKHAVPELLNRAVYGLPEIYGKEIPGADLVANPGCYTTTAILALAPALKGGFIEPQGIIVDALSGISGAGRSKTQVAYLYSELNDNAKAYGITTHRHTPEIEQELTFAAGGSATLTFTPHLVPMTRGILATCYASLKSPVTPQDITAHYESFYADAPFVRVCPPGRFPSIQEVRGTNMCIIGLTVDHHTNRLIVVSATDNLIKGAAGQAVQNLNLMTGVPETTNLPRTALYP
jgi:N-acetyl-gamma-glutamyl-phosphate reductase